MKTNKSISIGFKYPNYKNFDEALIQSCSNLGVKLKITHHSRGWFGSKIWFTLEGSIEKVDQLEKWMNNLK